MNEKTHNGGPQRQKDSGPPIEIHDLHKSFGQQRVLQGLNLRVDGGETVAVLGQSGSGKSVLLKLIIRLQAADRGSIHVAGQDIAGATPEQLAEVRKKIGFLFQNAALYDSLTVEENIAFPMRRHADKADKKNGNPRDRVRELLSEVGLEKDARKMPSQLSGGMQKRVGLARALALQPEILLLDEPTAGLDPITAGEIVDLILGLKKKGKLSAVVVTHDVHSAKAFSDRMLVLREGKVKAEGSFEELKQSHDDYVAQFLGESAGR
jgi:phospholipid/cholesterol/gamma-HCH transport system ATP-binding protein